MKDAINYGADLSRNNALLKLVEGEKEKVDAKPEAGGSVPEPADKPTLRAKKGTYLPLSPRLRCQSLLLSS